MAEYDDEGTLGSAARVPMNTWFDVDTTTGAWQLPGTAPISPALSSVPALGGVPDEAPLAIGQVAGTLAPQMTMPASMQRVQRLDQAGLLPPQPSVWENIARGIGMASPMGRAILQASDQQQQQQFTNRLALRRQELTEQQETRAASQDSLNTFLKISQMPSKTMRNVMFDRYAASMADAGQPLPADMVEAFKKSSLDEGKQMATMLQPMFEAAGIDPTAAAQMLQEGGDPKRLMEMLDMGLKVKKQKADEAEEARLTQSRQTLFGASTGAGTPVPATEGLPARPRGYVEGGERQPVIGLDTLAPSFLQKTGEVATRLGMNPQDLLRIMSFETGGTFNPAEKNRAGSGATGLIQFTEQTAKNLGTTTEALAKMTPEEQLDYVEKYLTPYKGKLGSLKDAYLAVFKPAAIGQGLDTPLYTKDKDGLAYTQNAALDMGNKGRATVGDALGAVMRTTTGGAATGVSPAPDTSHLVAGTGAPAPTVSATDQAQLTRLNQQISAMDQFIAANVGSGRERTKSMVNEVQQMRSALVQEREKLMETSRAVEKQRALQPGVLEQQRVHGADAARIALEQKGEERIGPDVGRKLNLPAATKWKDVPADRKSIEDPSATERKGLTDLRAGVAGVDRLLTMLDKPEVQKMVGTLFTEPEATVNRVLGQWLSTLSPEQRKFGATLASEIMEIRHRLIGAGQTGIEVNALAPMMPSPGDTDVATLRAKLEALREGMLRRHDAQRDDLEGMGYRVPAKLARPAEASKPGPNVKKFEDALN